MGGYPGATWHPSSITHPSRPQTLGIVIHWTSGHEAGDIATLDGPGVDVQFYVTKSGKVYQFVPIDSQAWHAFHTANTYCIGIEHEGNGEPWTTEQFAASAKLSAWLCDRYSIPVAHVQPRSGNLSTWHGLFGHRDLAGIDGNDHNDSVPTNPGWDRYLTAIHDANNPVLPYGGSLRLYVEGHPIFAGWDEATGPLLNISRNGLKTTTACWIAWKGNSWKGSKDVTNVCKNLARTYNLG